MAGQVDLALVREQIDGPHVIEMRPDGWTIRHPLACRPALFECPVNRAAERDLEEARGLGRYRCELDGSGNLAIGGPISTEDVEVDVAAMVEELEELRARYGRDGEVWCGARRDQAGSAYCVEMAGHGEHGVPHMWSRELKAPEAR